MAYDIRVRVPGTNAIAFVRVAGRRPPPCCKCGAHSSIACDWILKDSDPQSARSRRTEPYRSAKAHARRKTCDAQLCIDCTYSPAPGKDLCPTHAAIWRSYLERRATKETPAEETPPAETSD